MGQGPYAGVRVIEASIPYAAAYCGMQLADLGADVIKLEPPGGVAYRAEGPGEPDHNKLFQWLDRGKRSLVLDLKDSEGQAILHRLATRVDVILTNIPRSERAALGLDAATLSRRNPRLIYTEISGFGERIDPSDRPMTDAVALAYGGGIAFNRKLEDDGAPGVPRVIVAELPAGLQAAIGIGSALYNRERSGFGEHVEVSLLRVVMSMNYYAPVRDPISDAYNRDMSSKDDPTYGLWAGHTQIS